MTPGSVLFAGTAGLLSQDNAKLFWDDTNTRLGIGTATPGTKLVISGNAAAPPTPFADTTVQVMGANNTNPGLTFNSFASGYWPGLYGSHANGTGAVPTGCVVDDVLFRLAGVGYTSASAYSTLVALIDFKAAETYSATAQGSYISFSTTAKTTAAPAERMRILDIGNVGIGTAAPGARLNVSNNAAAPPTPFGTSALQVSGADGANTGFTMNSFGSGYLAGFYGSHANGTNASPTGCVADDVLFRLAGIGYNSAGAYAGTTAIIDFRAAETYSGTADGSYISFYTTTKSNIYGLGERMRIDSTGNVGIGTTAPKSPLHVVTLPTYASNAAAVTGGLTAGAFFKQNTSGSEYTVRVVV
jgi:hypothetical protein